MRAARRGDLVGGELGEVLVASDARRRSMSATDALRRRRRPLDVARRPTAPGSHRRARRSLALAAAVRGIVAAPWPDRARTRRTRDRTIARSSWRWTSSARQRVIDLVARADVDVCSASTTSSSRPVWTSRPARRSRRPNTSRLSTAAVARPAITPSRRCARGTRRAARHAVAAHRVDVLLAP